MHIDWSLMSDEEIHAHKRWTVEFTPFAIGALKTMTRRHAALLLGFIDRHLQATLNPQAIGKPLRYTIRYKWQYRVGDYRMVCQFDQERLSVIIITIQCSFQNLVVMDDETDME